MRTVIQRVKQSKVVVEGECTGSIGAGLLILAGFEEEDEMADIEWMAKKILQLRILDDEHGVMNESVLDRGFEILVVSQFTLHALTKKGNRPSYIRAARPEKAIPYYEQFISLLRESLPDGVQTGRFGAMMEVSLVNDGPVTIIIDSRKKE